MRLNKRNVQTITIYALILGTLYLVIGAIEFITGFWDLLSPGSAESVLGIPVDVYGGFATIVIGAAYFGTTSLWRGRHESLGFVLVGSLLSAVFGALYLLIVGADGLEALLACWSGEKWTWEWLTSGTAGPGLLRPEIWLAFISLPLGYTVLKATKTEKKIKC
ncbi:hypothetical protein J7L33_01090 [Candidatus Bathyarchaeota archaeon]|nr:hypothetical protein [Candidatus Bathyarchaeota archaeon]